MIKLREVVYMCLDRLKLISDDTYFTEEHIIFQVGRYRSFLLKQKYDDYRKPPALENTSEICLDLIEVPAICGEPCEGGSYLRSSQKIPSTIARIQPQIYPLDYYQGTITFISRERMRHIGYNKYMQNIIYCSIGPDGYLYFKSSNPQFLFLKKVRMNAMFSDLEEIADLLCNEDGEICDILDTPIPLESALIPPLIELVVKELAGPVFIPEDNDNNAKDDQPSTIKGGQNGSK